MINPGMFGGDFDLGDAMTRQQAAGAQSAAQATRRDQRHLDDRLERLSLVCMAMWSLLQDKTGVTEQDLLERVKVIDLMDGQGDGKAGRTIARCPQCDRVMSPRHRKCLYCGGQKLVESAFDAV